MESAQVGEKLVRQMEAWEGDSNCGVTSSSCPDLPCGQVVLHTTTINTIMTINNMTIMTIISMISMTANPSALLVHPGGVLLLHHHSGAPHPSCKVVVDCHVQPDHLFHFKRRVIKIKINAKLEDQIGSAILYAVF